MGLQDSGDLAEAMGESMEVCPIMGTKFGMAADNQPMELDSGAAVSFKALCQIVVKLSILILLPICLSQTPH